MQAMLDSMGRAEREILRMHRTSPIISKSLAFAVHSIGDEALIGNEADILGPYRELLRRADAQRKAGAKATAAMYEGQAGAVMARNKALFLRLKPKGPLTPYGVATRIYNEWVIRGSGPRPAFITVRRWVAREVDQGYSR